MQATFMEFSNICFVLSQLFDSCACVNASRYGKTKDSFGWPEETEDLASTSAAATQTTAGTSTETDNVAVAPVQLTSLDRCEGVYCMYSLCYGNVIMSAETYKLF
jgi:hypothetical protein